MAVGHKWGRDHTPLLPALAAGLLTLAACSSSGDESSPVDAATTVRVSFLDEVLDAGEPIDVTPPDDVVFFAR